MTLINQSILLLLAQSGDDPDKQTTMTTVSPSEVSDQINKGLQHNIPWELLLVGIGTTLVVIVAISLKRWWTNRHEDPSPMVLFSAIARKAGLNWRDRYLLWRIARTFDLPTPIALMLSRGTLRHYGDLYLNSHAASNQRRNGHRLSQIEDALFG
jgi:hypothetical protein